MRKKPIKFKDNICSVKQYAQIIFETKNIKNEDDFLYGMVPKNWKIQSLKTQLELSIDS